MYIQVRQTGLKSERLKIEDIPAEGVHDLVLTIYPPGSLSGVVLNVPRNPVPGIMVELWAIGSHGVGDARPERMTDDAGRFRFDDLMASDYLLLALGEREIMNRNEWSKHPSPDDIARKADENPDDLTMAKITLGRGENVDDVVLVNANAGDLSISGRVVNGRGEPVQRARVRARGPLDKTPSAYEWPVSNTTETNAARPGVQGERNK
jgi:protocatechuate 3,4-dioxygenase beta subunit